MCKTCKKCGVEKPHAEFSKDKKTKDGLFYCCKACASEHRKKYYEVNREQECERNKKYKEENREQVLEQKKKWREANPHICRANCQKHRARKKEAAVDLTDNERLAIQLIHEDAHILGWHVDHIVPLSKGGLHHPDNLQIVRSSYNLSKKDKLWQDRKYV
jgi:hypothetical protein|tara:strand:+ start:59 stop:538 length:480 start_codon:yes stop_codon:yes gene_type:complete